jgi:magnesium transporter
MVLHFPLFNRQDRRIETGEIDILINNEYLVTSCLEHQEVLDYFFQEEQQKQKDIHNESFRSPYLLLLKLIDHLWSACFPKLDHITDNLFKIESEIFLGNEKEMVKEISIVKRNIQNFRRIVQPQRTILESLASNKTFQSDQDLKIRTADIIGANIRVWHILENHKETIDSLEATNDSLFSYKLNETIKTLTIFSIVLLPGTLVTGIFGMNTKIPINSYALILGIVFSLMLLTFLLVKIKKWL